MKYLGIDYGTRRIGIAVSDDTGRVAFPLAVVEAGPEALAKVASLAREKGAEVIVVGESRDYKNEPNAVMEDIEQFKKDLAELAKLEVAYEPEFMTSAMAQRQGQDKRGEGGVKTGSLDAAAAALILQSYLDRHQ